MGGQVKGCVDGWSGQVKGCILSGGALFQSETASEGKYSLLQHNTAIPQYRFRLTVHNFKGPYASSLRNQPPYTLGNKRVAYSDKIAENTKLERDSDETGSI